MTESRDDGGREHGKRRRRSESARRAPNLGRSAGNVARVLLLGLITLAPWLMVVLRPSTEFWALAVSSLCLLFWGLTWLGPQSRFEIPLAVLPLAAGILLAMGQLVPWPRSLYSLATPGGAALENRLSLAEVEASADSDPQSYPWPTTISLYPAGTRHELSMLILAATVFLVSARFLSHERNLFWLCVLLAGNGAALAFFGLVQKLTFNGKLFWTIPISIHAQPFSTFVNRNNAAGFLNMALAGAIGLLYWSMERSGRPPGAIPHESDSALVRRLVRWWDHARWRVSRIDGYQIGALALTGVIVTGILYSLSRGGFVAMAAAAGITMVTAMIVERRFSGAIMLGVVMLVALGLLGWVSGTDRVAARLASLTDSNKSDGRLLIWRDALNCASDFRSTGAGLGTYRYVYNLYQERPDESWYLHAENQYVEALVEAGIPGLILVLASLGFMVWCVAAMLRRTRDPAHRGLLLMGVFAVSSQAVNAGLDFGLYMPANMLLFAAICGSLAGQATHGTRGRERSGEEPPAPRWWRSDRLVLPLLVLGSLWGLRENWRIWSVAAASDKSDSERIDDEDRQALVLDRIEQLASALESRPDDLEGQLALSELHIAHYQSRAKGWLEPLVGPQASADLIFLHAWVHHLKRTGQTKALEALKNPDAAADIKDPALAQWAKQDVARGCLAPSLERLRLANLACPLDARVNLGLAKLVWLDDEWSQEDTWLARTRLVAPADGNLFAEAGLLEQNLGQIDAAWKDWRKALAQGTRYESMILKYAVSQLSPAQLLDKVLPASPEYLVRVATTVFNNPEQQAIARQIIARAKTLLDDDTELPRAQVYYLRAKLHVLDGEGPQAVKAYERALKQEPDRVAWRVEFARLLRAEGELERALDEARRSLREGVASQEILALLKDINDARAAQSKKNASKTESPNNSP